MFIRKAYKFRAYPDAETAERYARGIGCVRLVYNLALAQREMFGRRGRRLDPGAELVELKRQFPFVKQDSFSQSLQQALRDLDTAFQRFFDGVSGYPQPRRRGENDSMRFPQPYTKSGPQIILGHDSIKLPKFGWVKIIRHRKIKGRMRNVTVKREGERWFVVIQTEIEVAGPSLHSRSTIGLDMGVNKPVATSDDHTISLPQMSAPELARRKVLCRILSRRKKGSVGRRQARLALRRFDRHIANRRNDARHKETTRLVKSHGLIGIEDLRVRNMTRSARGTVQEPGRQVAQKAGLNRRMLDVAPAEFRRQLEYKGRWYGCVVIAIPPSYTSQDCSVCGSRNRIGRDQRLFHCDVCGIEMCRDTNAARNIEQRAIVEFGRRTGGISPWIEPRCRPEAGTPMSAMIQIGMQAGGSLCFQAEE